MNKSNHTISGSLFEAMDKFAGKILTIISRDPYDTGELACLYSCISGIDECVKALAANNFLTPGETEMLNRELKRLYGLCNPS